MIPQTMISRLCSVLVCSPPKTWHTNNLLYKRITSLANSQHFPYVNHLNKKITNGEPLVPVRICRAIMLPETGIEEVVAILDIATKHKAANEFVYGAAITRLAKVDKIDEAFTILKNMKKSGFKPNSVVYTNIISALIKVGRLDTIMDLLEDMKNGGVELTVVTYNALFGGLSRTDQLGSSVLLLQKIDELGLIAGIDHYNFVVDALAKQHAMDVVVLVLDMMKKRGFSPTQQTYNAILSGYCNIGDATKIIDTVAQMKPMGFKLDPNTYNGILKSMCRHRQFEFLDKVLSYIDEDKIEVIPIPVTRIIDHILEAGDVVGILGIIDKLEGKGCVSYEGPVALFVPLFGKLSKSAGGLQVCEKITVQMQKHGIKPNTAINNCLLDGYLSVGSIDKAIEIYNKMLSEQAKPKQRSINALKDWCGTHKRTDLLSKLGFM